jgi:hydrogenase maturation protease
MRLALLVIGYGNELRGDDGVGPRIARAVSSWGLPQVRALDVQQLTPELADAIGQADRVVFVDAAVGGEEVRLSPLQGKPGLRSGHGSNPRELLALAELLHGKQPEAWLLTVPAENIELSEKLSPSCARGLEAALHHLRDMADRWS